MLGAQAPAGESPSAKETVKSKPKRQKPPVMVQLTVTKESPDVGPSTGTGSGSGAGSGTGSGSGESPLPGNCTNPQCDEQNPPVVEQPKVELPKVTRRLPPLDLAKARISGREDLQPPEHVKRQMIEDERRKSTATFELCVDESGAVSKVRMLVSTKYADYDNLLGGAIRSWRYRPQVANGVAVSVCSTVTFIYSIK